MKAFEPGGSAGLGPSPRAAREKPYEATVRAKRMNLWKLREFIAVDDGRPTLDTRRAADKEKGPGQAMVLPRGTPPQVLELMQACWSGKPRERPQSFTEIRERLSKMLEASDDELGLGHRLAIEGDGKGELDDVRNPMHTAHSRHEVLAEGGADSADVRAPHRPL